MTFNLLKSISSKRQNTSSINSLMSNENCLASNITYQYFAKHSSVHMNEALWYSHFSIYSETCLEGSLTFSQKSLVF
jgi:hypothetical protein